MLTLSECDALIFQSYARNVQGRTGYDQHTRNLDGMRQLFERARIPQRIAPTVTVTGSKGKGTTAILAAAFIQSKRKRVGLLTSPHYATMRERVRVNGLPISEGEWRRIISLLAPHILAVDEGLPAEQYLSPTGIFLAIAMVYFRQHRVDAVVLEVGRGGRFDDVSLIENDVTLLTRIGNEHLDKLGPRLSDVAWHKAGLIRRAGHVVTAEQPDEVMAEIESVAAERNASLVRVGEDIIYTQTFTRTGQLITLRHNARSGPTLRLRNSALFLGENAALAYGALHKLFPRSRIDDTLIERLRFPGRVHEVSQEPRVFVDGAVNGESARLFYDSVAEVSRGQRVLVVGLPTDKDSVGVLGALAPRVHRVIVTEASASHLAFSDEVLAEARARHAQVTHLPDVEQAFAEAVAAAGERGTVWVVGTQSLVRDALHYWRQDSGNLFG